MKTAKILLVTLTLLFFSSCDNVEKTVEEASTTVLDKFDEEIAKKIKSGLIDAGLDTESATIISDAALAEAKKQMDARIYETRGSNSTGENLDRAGRGSTQGSAKGVGEVRSRRGSRIFASMQGANLATTPQVMSEAEIMGRVVYIINRFIVDTQIKLAANGVAIGNEVTTPILSAISQIAVSELALSAGFTASDIKYAITEIAFFSAKSLSGTTNLTSTQSEIIKGIVTGSVTTGFTVDELFEANFFTQLLIGLNKAGVNQADIPNAVKTLGLAYFTTLKNLFQDTMGDTIKTTFSNGISNISSYLTEVDSSALNSATTEVINSI